MLLESGWSCYPRMPLIDGGTPACFLTLRLTAQGCTFHLNEFEARLRRWSAGKKRAARYCYRRVLDCVMTDGSVP